MEIDLDEVGKLVALGHTVRSHSDAPVEWPMIWIEPPECLIADGEPVVIPPEVEEAGIGPELTAVVGGELHRATPAAAADAIDGFTVSVDVSASGDWPGSPGGGIVSSAYKMFPTFRPVQTGAVAVDADAAADRRVTATIDGRRVADGSTGDFRFPIPAMVAEVSRVFPLHPGDLVALGEPATEGGLRGASEFSARIEGIGALSHPVDELDGDPVPGLGGE